MSSHQSLRLGLIGAGLGLLLMATGPAAAEEKLKSPDGSVEVTIRNDGIVVGTVKESGKPWEFPREPYRDMKVKGVNHKTAFAPQNSRVVATFGPTLYIAYGQGLYCLDATRGTPNWMYRQLEGTGDVTFSFEGDHLVVTVGSATTKYDMKTGLKLK